MNDAFRNPMDAMEIARDLIRKEEAELLHNRLHAERMDAVQSKVSDDWLRGMDEAMLILDARIEELRERWG